MPSHCHRGPLPHRACLGTCGRRKCMHSQHGPRLVKICRLGRGCWLGASPAKAARLSKASTWAALQLGSTCESKSTNVGRVLYLDEHAGLVVGVGGEDLLLLGGDGGVAPDQRGLHSTPSSQKQACAGGNILSLSLKEFCCGPEVRAVCTASDQCSSPACKALLHSALPENDRQLLQLCMQMCHGALQASEQRKTQHSCCTLTEPRPERFSQGAAADLDCCCTLTSSEAGSTH